MICNIPHGFFSEKSIGLGVGSAFWGEIGLTMATKKPIAKITIGQLQIVLTKPKIEL
jgi:hypothetical protein